MTPTERKKINKTLTKYLKDKGKYEATDDTLIENLIYNLELIEDAKADIKARGQLINLRKSGEEPYYQTNFSITVYHNALKAVQQLYKQLGIEKEKQIVDNSNSFDQLENLVKGNITIR